MKLGTLRHEPPPRGAAIPRPGGQGRRERPRRSVGEPLRPAATRKPGGGLAGCATGAGFGRDVQSLGHGIENTAKLRAGRDARKNPAGPPRSGFRAGD